MQTVPGWTAHDPEAAANMVLLFHASLQTFPVPQTQVVAIFGPNFAIHRLVEPFQMLIGEMAGYKS